MLNEPFILAQAHHSAGRFAEAVRICQEILQQAPNHIETLHLCGRATLDLGQPNNAVPLLAKAAQARPDSAAWRFDYGFALQAAGQIENARVAYRQSLTLNPGNADGWCRLAVVSRKLQTWDEAAAAYRHALELEARSEEALLGLANIHLELSQWKEAGERYRELLALHPNHPDAHHGLGLAYKGAQKPREAAAEFRTAIATRPRFLEALFNLGSVLQALEQWHEAIGAYEQALALAPNSPEVLGNLGNALWGARDFESALAAHEEAIRLNPEHAASYNNLGNTLLGLRRFAEATAAFERSLALDPSNASALCNLGNAHLAQNRIEPALEFYERALKTKPDFQLAVFNRSLVHLLRGDFKAGLPGYELRWMLKQKIDFGELPQGRWDCSIPLAGKTVLLCGEQGLGDTIQFVRYVPLLQQRGAKVVLRVQTALKQLISCLPGAVITTSEEPTLPPFDYYSLMLSLPLAFGTELNTVPANIPYLSSPKEKTRTWHERLAPLAEFKIGLVASGNSTHRNDYNRSIPLSAFLPLMSTPRTRFFLVQKEVRREDEDTLIRTPGIASLAHEIHDFTDTAAIVENLDLIITSDTSVAHLAGAMGKPVWTLLPFAPDWRWLLDRQDCPWYPTMRLFRQPTPGDWASVIKQVGAELASRTN